MTLPAWPGTLPAFALSDSFQSQQRENRIFFGTEVGPGKTRRRTTARTRDYNWSFIVNASERSALDTLFETTLVDGTSLFTMDDPVRGDNAKFMFGSTVTYTDMGGANFKASFKLVRMP
jgi:hypothetical protein